MSKTYSLDELNLCSAQAFVDVLGGIFEHSPWVAEAVVAQRPFASVAALHQSMAVAVRTAAESARLKLIRA
ncbi:MAG: OHCU decarboxylase, partial [Burkholderiaceae bacterium]|nr:OHCU decarboxylase [Burkholderiaceae bacterium]